VQTEVLPLELFSVSGYVTIGKSANKILKILAFNNFLNKHLEIKRKRKKEERKEGRKEGRKKESKKEEKKESCQLNARVESIGVCGCLVECWVYGEGYQNGRCGVLEKDWYIPEDECEEVQGSGKGREMCTRC
jgi:hypothetical protein